MDDNAIVLADATGVIRFWSGGAVRMFGYAVGQALGQTLDLIVPPEYREAHWQGFRRAMDRGAADAEGQASPFPARCADGQILERPGRLTLVRHPDGTVAAAMVVFG